MTHSIKNSEKGMALILVISVLSIVMVLVLSMMSQGQVAQVTSRVSSGRADLRYKAESALSRAIWLYSWDRKRYRNDHLSLGSTLEFEREEDPEKFQPWLANSNPHWIKEASSRTSVKVHDAARGKDISKTKLVGQSIRKLNYISSIEDEDFKKKLIDLSYSMDDYVDRDDTKTNPDYGLEAEDYESLYKMEDFPANQPFQFKEEIYWIPNIEAYMTDTNTNTFINNSFRIIPPRRWQKGPKRTGSFVSNFSTSKESTFSSPSSMVAREVELEEDEMVEFERFKAGEIDWNELDPEVQAKVNKFSRKESGVATFEVTSYKYDGEVSFTLKYTADCRTLLKSNKKHFFCWEQVLY